MERRVGVGTALVERGGVDSDEIGRRNAREVLAWGDPGMDRRKTERMQGRGQNVCPPTVGDTEVA